MASFGPKFWCDPLKLHPKAGGRVTHLPAETASSPTLRGNTHGCMSVAVIRIPFVGDGYIMLRS